MNLCLSKLSQYHYFCLSNSRVWGICWSVWSSQVFYNNGITICLPITRSLIFQTTGLSLPIWTILEVEKLLSLPDFTRNLSSTQRPLGDSLGNRHKGRSTVIHDLTYRGCLFWRNGCWTHPRVTPATEGCPVADYRHSGVIHPETQRS